MHRVRAQSGFTLIELVLVLAVLAIMFAMAAPNLRGFGQGQNLENAGDRLLAAATWARSEAVATSADYRLEIEPDGSGYHVSTRVGETYEPVTGEFGASYSLPPSMQLACLRTDGAALAGVDFFPNGRISPATLTLTDSRGKTFTVEAVGAADPLRKVERSQTP